jgi:tetratricopeptide (TPR) repeat protein
MDARDGSADVVEVEASGRRESKVAAAVQARSIDYEPIVSDTVAGLAPTTADKRREIYAHAHAVITRGLAAMGLPEAIVELEEFALDLAIVRVEQRWRATEAAEELAAQPLAAEEAIRPIVPEPGIMRSAIVTASTAASLRGVAWPIGVALALPVTAAMIFFVSQIEHKVADRSAVDDRVPHRFSHHNGDPGRTTRVAARNVPSARRSAGAAPIQTPFTAASEAAAPSPASLAAKGGSATCASGSPASAPDSCARDPTARIAAAPIPKTEARPPSLESYSPFSDMIRGFGPSNALNGPTVAAEDFVAGSAMPYTALVPDAAFASAPPSPAAAPLAAPPQERQSPPAKPINPKVAALITSGKQAALKDDLDRAVHDFSEAIRIDPKYPDSYLERGKIYFKLGETERAIADYSAALAHDPQHAAAFRARGMAHLYSGKNDLALADLSKAIELAEHDPRLLAPLELFYARRSRGALYDSKQQYDLEIADCTAIIESSTHDRALAEALAANYGSPGTANILARLYRQRAGALVRTSRAELAVADLTEAIRLSSDRGYTALLDRAKLHELLGRRDLALADARAALNIRPSSEEAQLELSRLSGLSNPAPPKGL